MCRSLFFLVCLATFQLVLSDYDSAPPTPASTTLEPEPVPSEACCANGEDGFPPICGQNEAYDNCTTTNYLPEHCSEVGYPLDLSKPCQAGCKCKENYARNDQDVCIPIDDCPSCGGDKNAQYGCGTNCGKMCGDVGKPVACPASCIANGCDCRDGYQYDSNQGGCVKKEDCTPICKKNEVYSSCINGGPGPKNCSHLYAPYVSIDNNCVKGCICKHGYLRDANNKCIPKDQCPTPICKKNEVYSSCINGGPGPKNCSHLYAPYVSIDSNCVEGCICKHGYLRDANNKCIPKDQCPKTDTCPGPNEYYEPCIHNCGSEKCSDIGKIYHCPNQIPGKCDSSGCRCNPGYLRNARGVCVPQKDCPPPNCPPNQIWDTCPTVKCEGDYCPKSKDSPQTCPVGIVCDPPRCVCFYNTKKAANGTCIPIPDCPPFKCGKNEEYQACPYYCPGEKCSDYINKPKCPLFNIGITANCRPACKCRKGYYRDDQGNCIPACDCTIATTTPKAPKPTTDISGCGD